jgi:hypothetical protein
VNEPEPEETTDRHPRNGARERLVDRGPEEIGWARWMMLRPALAAYLMLGLAFLAPLVIVSINYGRVSSQNAAIAAQNRSLSKQNERLADVVRAIQTNREEAILLSCDANNAQNTAILSLLTLFHVDVNGNPKLKRAVKPLSIRDCQRAVQGSKTNPRLGP